MVLTKKALYLLEVLGSYLTVRAGELIGRRSTYDSFISQSPIRALAFNLY